MFLYGQGAQGGGASPAGGGASMLIMMALIFVIFYFIIIRPAKNKQKKHQNLVTSLKGGERVVTAGGIYGTVTRVLEDRFEVEVDKNTKLQIAKSSVSAILDSQQPTQKAT